MISFIKEYKFASIFIGLAIIVVMTMGVWNGVTYLQHQQRQEFIEDIKPGAKAAYEEHGILPSLTMAQAIHESAWGKSHISNNLFGIKAGPRWDGKRVTRETWEYIDGQSVTVNADFRAYDSFEESVKDYGNFLASNRRYKKVLEAQNYKEAVQEVYNAGYATDPEYTRKVTDIIEKYELYKYDEKVQTQEEKEEESIIEIIIIEGVINDIESQGFLRTDESRIYVPIREVGETLGINVEWDPDERIWRVEDDK